MDTGGEGADRRGDVQGSRPSAKTYRSKVEFVEKAVAPFGACVSVPLKPTVRSMYADGDEGCCQANANRSLRDACRAFVRGPYTIIDRHSAWAAERRSL